MGAYEYFFCRWGFGEVMKTLAVPSGFAEDNNQSDAVTSNLE